VLASSHPLGDPPPMNRHSVSCFPAIAPQNPPRILSVPLTLGSGNSHVLPRTGCLFEFFVMSPPPPSLLPQLLFPDVLGFFPFCRALSDIPFYCRLLRIKTSLFSSIVPPERDPYNPLSPPFFYLRFFTPESFLLPRAKEILAPAGLDLQLI